MKHVFTFLLLLIGSLLAVPARAQPHRIDSLERLLAVTPADTSRVLLLSELSYQYKNWGDDPAKTKQYAEQCMQLATQLHFAYGMGLAHYAMGGYYANANQNPQALQQFERALPFYRQAHRKRELAHTYRNMGIILEDMGNYSRAMDYYMRSIQVAEAIGEKGLVGHAMSNLGVFMLNQKKYEQALHYLFQALPIHQKTKHDRLHAFTLNAIGLVYLERKEYGKAEQYLYACLHLCDSLNIDIVKVNCYRNIGLLHVALQQYEQARSYFEKVLVLGGQLATNQLVSMAHCGIGNIYRQTGETAQAIVHYRQALQIAEAHRLMQEKIYAHEGLMQAYAFLQNYPQAYHHQSAFVALRDSVFNQENDRKIAQLEAAYAMEKKQAEIALLQKDQQQQIWARNTIVAGLLISLLITGLVVNRQRLKIRQNRLLVQKSEEIAAKNQQLERQALVMATQADQLAATNTQLERQSAQLEKQTHQLQALDQVKSRFFTNISHEFRTPLTLILAPLEKLLTSQVEPSQLPHHYRLIDRHARHLLQLINQLLDFSKLEAGSLKINRIRSDVNQRIKITALSFSSLAESKRIGLHFVSIYQHIETLFDPDVLEKILNNLLSNAFKFTPPEGRVTVEVALQENAPANQDKISTNWQLQLTVSDTGIGIPADQQDRIFDRFYQIDGSQFREQAGTGIGLALVKELVELQGGTIAVTSEAGSGSRFTVQIPLEECRFELKSPGETVTNKCIIQLEKPEDTSFVPLVSPVSAVTNETYPLMLIVEDNDEVRGFIRASFQANFRILEAADGAAGLKLAQKEIPDVIITDRMMPRMDGVALCHQIKTDERTSHVPVIMLTAKADAESKMEGLETGADDYVLKPFSVHELSVRVRNLITQRQQLRERFTREVKLQPKDIAITSADEVFLTKAIRIIEQRMADTDFSVEMLVREIGMSRVQLHRKLKALTDQSASEFIRTIRLKRAVSLMEHQYGNVAEIMYEVGFTNASYFASSFKKMVGVNPSEYCQQVRAHAQEEAGAGFVKLVS